MEKAEKQLNAVRVMRSIRDRISQEISGMTFDEQHAWIHECLKEKSIVRRRGRVYP